MYNSEYGECTSISSRLHQMFVHGNTVDCNHWHEDYINCLKWKKDKNIQAAVTIFKDILSLLHVYVKNILLTVCSF